MSPYGTCSSSQGGTSDALEAGRTNAGAGCAGRAGVAGAAARDAAGATVAAAGLWGVAGAAGRGCEGAAGRAGCAGWGIGCRGCAAGLAGCAAGADAAGAPPLPPMVNVNGTGHAHAWASAEETASWISGFCTALKANALPAGKSMATMPRAASKETFVFRNSTP